MPQLPLPPRTIYNHILLDTNRTQGLHSFVNPPWNHMRRHEHNQTSMYGFPSDDDPSISTLLKHEVVAAGDEEHAVTHDA